MRAGLRDGERLTIAEVWEAVGAEAQGRISRERLDAIERAACPGPGTCAGIFTANTMGLALELLGLARLGTTMVPADALGERRAEASACGALAVRMADDGVPGARAFLDRRALLNAMTGVAATGGAHNGV